MFMASATKSKGSKKGEKKAEKKEPKVREITRISYEKAAEITPPRETSKRMAVARLIKDGGQTIESVAKATGLREDQVRVSLRLLNKLNGYGFKEKEDGTLQIIGLTA
jgi:hypothetical protein